MHLINTEDIVHVLDITKNTVNILISMNKNNENVLLVKKPSKTFHYHTKTLNDAYYLTCDICLEFKEKNDT